MKNAKLKQAENELLTRKTYGFDYVCEIAKKLVGVSVIRIFRHPKDKKKLSKATIEKKLKKKLENINKSTGSFNQNILHVWALVEEDAVKIEDTWEKLDSEFKKGTQLVLTVAKNFNELFTIDNKKTQKLLF